jgi:hypothetical protein
MNTYNDNDPIPLVRKSSHKEKLQQQLHEAELASLPLRDVTIGYVLLLLAATVLSLGTKHNVLGGFVLVSLLGLLWLGTAMALRSYRVNRLRRMNEGLFEWAFRNWWEKL